MTMIKAELNHKLELIEINKEVIDIHQETIAEMGALTPPFIKSDKKKKQKEIRQLLNQFLELLALSDLSVENKILEELQTLKEGSLNGNNIFLAILIAKKILNIPIASSNEQILNARLGGTIIVNNSKNVVISPIINTGKVDKQANITNNEGDTKM